MAAGIGIGREKETEVPEVATASCLALLEPLKFSSSGGLSMARGSSQKASTWGTKLAELELGAASSQMGDDGDCPLPELGIH